MKTLRRSVKVAELSLRIVYAMIIVAAATMIMLMVADVLPIWAYTAVVITTVVAAHWANTPMTELSRALAFEMVLKMHRSNFYADSSLAREAVDLGFSSGFNSIMNQHWIRP